MKTEEIIQRLATEWATPRQAIHRGVPAPFLLSCAITRNTAGGAPIPNVPSSLAALWQQIVTARLFEDKQYGQWGLALLSPDSARQRTAKFRAERGRDYVSGDLVIGQFIGDAEALIVRCDPETSDFGRVLVALPLDPRLDWYKAADDVEGFLERYEASQGAKFWEEHR